MTEEQHPDIVWQEQLKRMGKILADEFPNLDESSRIKIAEDWVFCHQEVKGDDFIKVCFTKALEMFDLEISMGRGPEEFCDFIQPTIEVFYGKNHLDSDSILAIIGMLLDYQADHPVDKSVDKSLGKMPEKT